MKSKRIIAGLALMATAFSTAGAQEYGVDSVDVSDNEISAYGDSIMTTVDSISLETSDNIYGERYQKVWKKRKSYIYFTYGIQSIKSDYKKQNSDMAFAVMMGKTYYLHKKPILGMIKFGLDWNYLDLNFGKYPNVNSSDDYSGDYYYDEDNMDLGIMQLEAGMGIGPSVTVNPVDQLKACVYFHVTPSYSLMLQDENLYHHYATFFNVGLTVSYKIISIGFESRWSGKVDYDGLVLGNLDDVYEDDGSFNDPFVNIGNKVKTNTFRLFVGLRF